MDSDSKAGLALVALSLTIVAGLLSLTLQGNPFMLWADLIFGLVTSGLLLLGLRQIRPSND